MSAQPGNQWPVGAGGGNDAAEDNKHGDDRDCDDQSTFCPICFPILLCSGLCRSGWRFEISNPSTRIEISSSGALASHIGL